LQEYSALREGVKQDLINYLVHFPSSPEMACFKNAMLWLEFELTGDPETLIMFNGDMGVRFQELVSNHEVRMS
jgi:hypothetical protein